MGGGYCRLQMPLNLALGVRETMAWHRLGGLEGWGGYLPPFQCIPAPSPAPPPPSQPCPTPGERQTQQCTTVLCLRVRGGGGGAPWASRCDSGYARARTPSNRRQLQCRGSGVRRDAFEGRGPQRRPQRRLGRRLEEVALAVGGGYCRLQMPLRLALGVRGAVAGRRLSALGEGYLPPLPMRPCPHSHMSCC